MIGTAVFVIIVVLLFSAFFSGMEIAFLSSNKLKLEIEKKQSPWFGRIAETFVRHPSQYITTILVGNNIALVIYSMEMSLLIHTLMERWGLHSSVLLETVVSTILIIFAGEYLPKAVFRANPNFYFRLFSGPAWFFYILFYPVVAFTSALARGILRIFGFRLSSTREAATFDKVDLAHLVEEATDNSDPAGNENDIRLFQNAMEFHDLEVRDCMVPRIDMDAVEIDSPFEEFRRLVLETRYSRIPVYEGTIDNITGYATAKSLFLFPKTIREVVRPILYVTESMPVQRVLSRFIRDNSSIAVVIDEFGGTAGMITIEDILEEIFGEIDDEHDTPELIEKKIREGEYVFSGRLEVETLNEKYGLKIPETDEYDTLAGYILFKHNGLPKQGQTLIFDGMTVRILRASGSKIDLVRLLFSGADGPDEK
jgi:CBS domain containing-hemolysin-like protein